MSFAYVSSEFTKKLILRVVAGWNISGDFFCANLQSPSYYILKNSKISFFPEKTPISGVEDSRGNFKNNERIYWVIRKPSVQNICLRNLMDRN